MAKTLEELKEELKGMGAAARIKKLKEFEEQQKESMTEIGDLIEDSKAQLKVDDLADEISPEAAKVNINDLFEQGSENLEGAVGTAVGQDAETPGYISIKQAYDDYTALQDLYTNAGPSLSEAQQEMLDQIGERLDKTKYISSGDEAANLTVASRNVMYKIRKGAGLDMPSD